MARDAAAAVPYLCGLGRTGRAALLNQLADALERRRSDIVDVADKETALGGVRLNGELTRTCVQLRFMAEVVAEGSYLNASIDHPGDTPMGVRPDLRRTSIPMGPVAVFGASNFPLAFSVPGGDTASALAAGCPVIAKAHPSHVATSALIAEIWLDELQRFGAPPGVFSIVYGMDAGTALILDPNIKAVGFTGSLAGGRALFDLAGRRETPIPFYGELGSVNPLVVTAAAADDRGESIGAGIAASMTLGVGQFCTKPGLFLIPASPAGDRVVEALVSGLRGVEPAYPLNAGIREAYREGVARIATVAEVLVGQATTDGRQIGPVLAAADVEAVVGDGQRLLTHEIFGPFGLLVRYRETAEVLRVLRSLPATLTGTVHVGDADQDAAAITTELENLSGRIVYNGYPTGVAVSWSMQHGGPYPASTVSASTSVGAAAVGRWIRPLCYQDAPQSVLPDELRDTPSQPLPRRIDGRLITPTPQPGAN
ncbi:aldehyde dehydrogenase [Mycolicibacterium confluentis]|uniref:Aldehyde dehydrogenase n=2 Tax=Mycolicibacterium confluentis TaxID=28047 RepID=A0A7I7XX41_9MYCO|nr:aldehyde dehydrogenase [Mycolicibacterium confluentis]